MKKHKFIIEIITKSKTSKADLKDYLNSVVSFPFYEPSIIFDKDSIKVTSATRAKAAELLAEFKKEKKL